MYALSEETMLVYIYLAVSAAAGILISVFNGAGGTWEKVLLAAGLFLAAFIALVLLHALTLAVVRLFLNKDRGRISPNSFLRKFVVATLELAIALVRVKIHVTGAEKLPEESFVMVCNHRSLMNPVTALVVFRRYNLVFVSKKENENIPILGKFIGKVGCLFLDRENARAAVKTINSAADMVKSGEWSVAICPEGTRNRTDKLLLPFHAGSFKIAQKANCPLLWRHSGGLNRCGTIRPLSGRMSILILPGYWTVLRLQR